MIHEPFYTAMIIISFITWVFYSVSLLKLEKIQKEREAKQKKLLKDIYIKESEQEDALTPYPIEYERVGIK